MFYVYVLHSELDKGLYIGFTTDLKRRFAEHNSGKAQSTVYRKPLQIIYYEAYLLESDALGRERFLKSGAGLLYLDKQLSNYFQGQPRRKTT